MNRFHKFFLLSLSEKIILIRAWIVLIMVRIALVLPPFSVISRLTTKKGTKSATAAENITTLRTSFLFRRRGGSGSADKYSWAVTVASRYVPGATCLVRAIALRYLLHRAGHAGFIHIGVSKDEVGGLKAHAWVESRGKILIGGSNLKNYTRLLALE